MGDRGTGKSMAVRFFPVAVPPLKPPDLTARVFHLLQRTPFPFQFATHYQGVCLTASLCYEAAGGGGGVLYPGPKSLSYVAHLSFFSAVIPRGDPLPWKGQFGSSFCRVSRPEKRIFDSEEIIWG